MNNNYDSYRVYAPLAILLLIALLPNAHANYSLMGINTTMVLNTNTSAQVTDILELSVSNASVSQYSADRLSFNLTINQWQSIIGKDLIEHIVNPKGTIYNIRFLPGPLTDSLNGKVAYLVLMYSVSNVLTVNQTGPRTFLYTFNKNVFNFVNAQSGEVLGDNTTLTIVLPQGASVNSTYPPPDLPLNFGSTYTSSSAINTTKLVWNTDEPLSKFALTFTVDESRESEVLTFFDGMYGYFGNYIYVIIGAAIVLFILYEYLRINK
ncbi:MAG: hypothetical protein M1504_00280 [Candidatus Marsarchaeota archaeon]|nr:hypothetical protein [Candidatus Marsarchaeota archaeon]